MSSVLFFVRCDAPNSIRSVSSFLKFTISWFSSSQVVIRAKSSARLDLMVENDLAEV